jgi:undecaprenyl-diphosphatase
MTMTYDHASMSLIEAAVLGIVQGLTEFLPISSSAHLRVVPSLLGWHDPGAAYSAVIQLGSVIAVLAYFAKDLFEITKGCFASVAAKDYTSKDVRLVAAIILGTIPICVLGLLLKHVLEADSSPLRSLQVVGAASIGMAILLAIAEKVGRKQREVDQMGARDGLLIGLGQAMALIPGCSRSGSTLTFALFLGMKREDAARFSFLLGIPAIILSGLVELKGMMEQHVQMASMADLAVGLIAATVVSYAAIWWMLHFLRKHSTVVFIVYRLIFGMAVIGLATSGIIH